MTTVIVKNIDMKLLKEQKNLLVELVATCQAMNDNVDYYAPGNATVAALNGVINLLDAITDAGDDNKSLEEPEVDSMLISLKGLYAIHAHNDMTSKSQDRALAKAIQFIDGRPFPLEPK